MRSFEMKISKRTLLLTLLCASSCLAHKTFQEEESNESFLLNLIWKCTKTEDLGTCLKLKAANFLDKLVRMKEPLVITEYLSLAKDPKMYDLHYQVSNKSEIDLEGKSLRTEDEKNEHLDRIIWNKLVSLFTTRTIQLNLPSDMFEGRGKEDKVFKKGQGIFLMAAMMGGMMMKMALGKIALIAGKALMIAKIALVLSLIIALKKFASQGGGGHPEVVYTSSEHGSGRKFGDNAIWDEDGADLAYNAHNPKIYKNF